MGPKFSRERDAGTQFEEGLDAWVNQIQGSDRDERYERLHRGIAK